MTDERIIAYLLEELPDDDLEQFEDDCFAQESWPTQIELVEEELIDSYLRNELDSERRRSFEQNYLTTQARQERVSIAAALLRHIDQYHNAHNGVVREPPTETTWIERIRGFWSTQGWGLRAAAAIVVVAVIGGSLWLMVRSPSSPRVVASITLAIRTSNRADGAQSDKVRLPPGAEALSISLLLPPQSPAVDRYRAELENDNGERKSVEVTGKDAQSVLVMIPAAQLPSGQYALKLFTVRGDSTEQRINGSYFFVVE